MEQAIMLTVAGFTVGYFMSLALLRRRDGHWSKRLRDEKAAHWLTNDTLESLRDSCFLTNEKGHRVQYWNASKAVRDKAEGGAE